MWVLLALCIGGLLVLLAANLSSSEKKIEHQIEHLYAVGEPQFIRSMGMLLGPALLAGNRVTALRNGDQIFPAMLAAIRGAERTITFETSFTGRVRSARNSRRASRSVPGLASRCTFSWIGSARARWTTRCCRRWSRQGPRW